MLLWLCQVGTCGYIFNDNHVTVAQLKDYQNIVSATVNSKIETKQCCESQIIFNISNTTTNYDYWTPNNHEEAA